MLQAQVPVEGSKPSILIRGKDVEQNCQVPQTMLFVWTLIKFFPSQTEVIMTGLLKHHKIFIIVT